MSYLGALHWLGFKPQATAGTAETSVTTFLPTTSISLEANQKPVERKAWLATGVLMPSRKGPTKPNGKASAEVLASVAQPWYWLLGHVTTTQPAVGTDPTVYLHTITPDAHEATKQNGGGPVRLTAEADRVFTKSRQHDVFLDKLTLKGTAGEIATLDAEWYALGHTDGVTVTSTPAFADDVLVALAATVKIDGVADITVEGFELTIDGGLEQLATLVDGDGGPSLIRQKSPLQVSGKLKFVDFPAAEYAKLADADTFALEIELFGDTITHAYRKSLAIEVPACQYTGGLDPAISGEIITGDAEFAGFWDTVSGSQITVTAQNTVSAINA